MDDYLAIPSAVYRFAVAFLQADAGGACVRDALEVSVPPSPGAEVRVSFTSGRVDPPSAAGPLVAEVAGCFGRSLTDHLVSRGVRPELLREVGVEVVRGKKGRLRYRAVAQDDLGRGYVVQVVLPNALPIGFVIGAGAGGANAKCSAPDAEPGAAPDTGRR